MKGPITGISKTSLWNAWKEVRTEIREATVRDVVDYLDYDVDPSIWIERLLRQISEASYEPQQAMRFSMAKSGGFRRRLTIPAIPDIVLFRAIANLVHRKAQLHQQPHVYYRRGDLHKATQAAVGAAIRGRNAFASSYRF